MFFNAIPIMLMAMSVLAQESSSNITVPDASQTTVQVPSQTFTEQVPLTPAPSEDSLGFTHKLTVTMETMPTQTFADEIVPFSESTQINNDYYSYTPTPTPTAKPRRRYRNHASHQSEITTKYMFLLVILNIYFLL